MKSFWRLWATLVVVLSAGVAFVWAQPQNQIYVYSRGIFSPSEELRFELYTYGNIGDIAVTFNKVLEPLELLRLKPNDGYSAIKIPANIKTSLFKRTTVRQDRQYGQLNLGRIEAGLYLIGFSSGQAKGVGIALVTDLGMQIKRADKSVSVFTVNRSTGQRRSAAVYNADGNTLQQIRTDANGLGKLGLGSAKVGVMIANAGNNWAVSRAWWQSYAVEKYKVTGQTDRPLYKPGDSVSFRATVREGNTLKPISAPTISAVACYNQTELWRGKPTVNDFGTIGGTFALSKRAKTTEYDQYTIFVAPSGEATCSGSTNNLVAARFKVEDYIKPDFTVALEAQEIALQGNSIQVAASAEYLFGGGVSGGKVNVRVSRDQRYRRDDPRYADFGYYWGEWDYWQPRPAIVLEKNTVLNDTGKLEVSVPLERDPDNAVVAYTVTTTIEDETRRPQSTSRTILAYPSTVRVAVRSSRYVVKAGDGIEMEVRTRDLGGEGVSAPVELTLVRRDYWYSGNRWQPREERLETRTVTTNKGNALVKFKAPKGGGYSVLAKAKDPQNRISLGEAFVWVTEDNPSWYWWYDGDKMQIKLDKREYAVGDTAVAFISGIKQGADVWLTLEGSEVQNQRIARATSGIAAWTFKITPQMQPNITLKAGYIAGGRYNESEASISVPKVQERLSIAIQPAKQKFQASEQGQIKFIVRDANGKPVQTELGVTVVDKGVYLLKEDTTPNPFSVLHGYRPSLVGTASSEDEPLYIDAPRPVVAMAAPTSAAPGIANRTDMVAKTEEATAPEVKVRKDFRDTADWRASLVSDSSGVAIMTVPFPENLTTWRITARGQTIGAKAGEAKSEVVVTQDIIARIAQPSFLVRGDSFTMRGIVNNNRTTTSTGKFSIALNGLSAQSPLEQNLTVQPGQRGSFAARVSATKFGTAKVTAKFADGLGGDALELPLQIKPRGFTDGTGWAADAGRGARKLSIPTDTALESARLKISLTPSLLSAVRPALEQLVGYPYGCTEQTLSRFLPTLLAQQAFPRQDLPELLDAGLARLETLRHEDGGWGFWTEDQSTLEMTSQVVLALARAKSVGVKFEAFLLEGGVQWLRGRVNDAGAQRGARSVAYRALAEAGVAHESMDGFAALSDLEPYHLAQLALAYQKIGQLENARRMLSRLKASRIETESTVRWERPNRQYRWYYWWEDNPVLVTAVA
ncbi:MAG: alpha-2-macroglobulin family protein, partial [Deinococcales bacterium]